MYISTHMAITSSAKKALRASKKKAVFNARRQDAIKAVTKKIKKLVADKKIAEAQALIPSAYQAIDKAAKTHLIKPNNASRKKSRLMAMLVRAGQEK